MNALRPKREKGQSLLEFALVMPILIALLIAVMLLAWVGFSFVSISSAARMGTRHMLQYPEEPEDPVQFGNADEEITFIITSAMPFLDWQEAVIGISPALGDRDMGEQMVIHIEYPMNLPTWRIPYVIRPGHFEVFPPIILNAESRMTLID